MFRSPLPVFLGVVVGFVIMGIIALISDRVSENKEDNKEQDQLINANGGGKGEYLKNDNYLQGNDEIYYEPKIYKKPLREMTYKGNDNELGGRNYISYGMEWRGKNQTDVINQVLGTNYKAWMKSGVPMKKFGLPNVISWFTYLNGNMHGPSDDYLWKNYLSKDEETIQEKYVGNDVHFVEERYREEKKLCRYRLVFQRDPENRGEKYRYRFLGWYKLKNVDFNSGVHIFERVQKDGYLTDNPFDMSNMKV